VFSKVDTRLRERERGKAAIASLSLNPDPAFQVNPDSEPFRIYDFDDQKIKEIQQNTFKQSFF
jgi:hypothetical protein